MGSHFVFHRQPLRRVRVEHVTAWGQPMGSRRQWMDLRAPFQTLGFVRAADMWEADGCPQATCCLEPEDSGSPMDMLADLCLGLESFV